MAQLSHRLLVVRASYVRSASMTHVSSTAHRRPGTACNGRATVPPAARAIQPLTSAWLKVLWTVLAAAPTLPFAVERWHRRCPRLTHTQEPAPPAACLPSPSFLSLRYPSLS